MELVKILLSDMVMLFADGTGVTVLDVRRHPIYPYAIVSGTVAVAETVLPWSVPVTLDLSALAEAGEEMTAQAEIQREQPPSGVGDDGENREGTGQKTGNRSRRRSKK